MRESVRRALSVVMVFAVVGAGTVAMVNLDQGPEPVQQYGAVQEGEAAIGVGTAIAITLVAAGAGAVSGAVICSQSKAICKEDHTAERKAEKHETRVELLSRAGTASGKSEVFLDSMGNDLEGARSIARDEGMAALWSSARNNSTLSNATANANQTVNDFYTVKLKQVANSWNLLVGAWMNYNKIADDSGLLNRYVQDVKTASDGSVSADSFGYNFKNHSVTAPNGETVNFYEVPAMNAAPRNSGWAYETIEPAVAYQNGSLNTIRGPDLYRYDRLADAIFTQSAEVKQGIKTLADQSYGEAKSGELNISEYLSANSIAREYAREGNDQAWAAVRLSQMEDVGLPEDMENIGTVRLTSNGTTATGLFLSKSNPASGQFESGKTYNASEITGGQYLVNQSGRYSEITGEFVIEEITTPDGGSRDSMTINNPDYQATNISELQAMMKELRTMRAEINARQKKLMNDSNGGSGGLFAGAGDWIPGLNGIQSVVALIVALLAGMFGLRVVAGN